MKRDRTGPPPLRLQGIERIFGAQARIRALDGVDLEIDPGDYLAITGRSGAGKSTLLNVLGLLEQPTAGRYTVGDTEVRALRARQVDRLRGEIFGLVFQSFHLLDHLSVAQNVEVGLTYAGLRRQEALQRVEAVVEKVGLSHRLRERAATLSGGERQRVAIARTLARSPAILLADEPTGNLDESNAEAVLGLLDDVHAQGVTVIVVTHDEMTAEHAQRRIVVRDGRIERL
ncbi:ABC transporter ATP-binding protein [Ruania alkalisoli]|uniref:ABC transporter ATP-binding protein n=1 Tax=Ruania alkalisoli TaxID=2779775 RepID=UPI001FE7EEE7|nr:ABC transporter ATP-binding protein [Ruania alkalisoli]